MASSPITSWQIDGETMETMTDFIFLGSKITVDGACSHEIKRRLLLGRKAMTDLDSILKSRDNFANKGPSSQSYGFSSSHVWIGEGNGNPLQFSCQENPMDGGSWRAIVHGIAKSRTRLSHFTSPSFVIAFLPRSKRLLIPWLQSQSPVILEPKKIKSVTTSTFSSFAMK